MGLVRKNNEDNFLFNGFYMEEDNVGLNEELYFRSASDVVCFAVFDGIGGSDNGQTASYLAAREFNQCLLKAESDGINLDENFFEDSVNKMNMEICNTSKASGGSMGTTAALLALISGSAYFANLGDSKIFRFKNNMMTQISVDHFGEIRSSDGEARPKKPALRQFLGKDDPEVYIMHSAIKPGDKFLLCTDGLTDMVPEDVILDEIEKTGDVRLCVRKLMNLALKNGGRDNITAILVSIYEKN